MKRRPGRPPGPMLAAAPWLPAPAAADAGAGEGNVPPCPSSGEHIQLLYTNYARAKTMPRGSSEGQPEGGVNGSEVCSDCTRISTTPSGPCLMANVNGLQWTLFVVESNRRGGGFHHKKQHCLPLSFITSFVLSKNSTVSVLISVRLQSLKNLFSSAGLLYCNLLLLRD